MPGSILLADDEEKILKTLGRALRDEGYEVTTAANARDAARCLNERAFDLLVIDFLMPDRTGLDVIRDLVASAPDTERPAIVMMTAHGSIESAVEAMKLGACDYLQKPFEVDELLVLARRALDDQRARTGLRYLLSERDAEFDHYGIIGRSRPIRDVITRAELVAESKSTVLVTGETGTGKELVARAIHARSAQRNMPMIKVNCAAIPETLLESELFGHVRGAFTGASFTKKGRFALADGGTIFLDEIGTVALSVQAKLLRVLQDREFEPLGAERTQRVDVRVIAATNRDLRQLVAGGKFLEDLFYRLNVIPIEMPPLRERPEDIRPLVDHFVRRFAERTGKKIDGVDEKAMAELTGYRWWKCARTREHDRARRGSGHWNAAHQPVGVADERVGHARNRCRSLAEAAPESGMGGTRDHAACARTGARCQERRGGADGHQSTRAQPLPRQAPD